MIQEQHIFIAISGILGILIVFLGVVAYHYYEKSEVLKEENTRLKNAVGSPSVINVTKVLELANQLISLFTSPPVAFAKNKIRNVFELQLDGVVKCRVKVSKRGEPTRKETHKGDLYFKLGEEETYISWKDLQKLKELKTIESKLSFLHNLSLSRNFLEDTENC